MAPDDLLSKRDRGIATRERIIQRYQLGRTVVRTCGAVAIAYFAKDFLVAIAGKETIFALKLSFFAHMKFFISIGLTGCACAWALAERWLRHRKVKTMQTRIIELKSTIDPKRTSSGLTPTGRTNPKDKRP